ncbi:MAG: UDP-N-acetylmuramoyl-L-alanyl-D-glutamate--2,6-diaminopimelate ligase [Patescibacteria group bacterium]
MNPKKLVRKVLPDRGIRMAEEAYRKSRIYALQSRYGFPTRGMRIIAVTGTNGKTTTCSFLNEIIKSAGYKTGVITTAYIEIAGKRQPNLTHRTVPLSSELLQIFKKAKAKKVDFFILEATSQALHQHKFSGFPIEVAVMTNLTQDHLDYHGTMERYAAAKARLFDNYCKPDFVVLNRDDKWYQYFEDRSIGQELSYGKHPDSTLQLIKSKTSDDSTDLVVTYGSAKQAVTLPLPGEFNVSNALAAMTAALAVGVSLEKAAGGISKVSAVAGRMQSIEAGQPFKVYVDFAVSPDAIEKVLQSLKSTAKGRVIIVFGATGDRDKGKRADMGKAAAKHADLIFLTDDETYTEDPEVIRQAVYKGIVSAKGKAKTTIIADREEAIRAAFQAAKKSDVVLLAGIGHEDYRNMGGKKLPWNEAAVAKKYL